MPGHEIPSLFDAYVIDANVLLNFWVINNDEPFGKDVHKSAWNYLESQIEDGRILSPIYVRAELLKHGPPELYEWVKTHEEMFVPIQEELLEPLAEIVSMHPVYKTTNGSQADAAIVALAKARNLCVITSEKHEGNKGGRSAKNPKIPNVCEDMDVEWVSPNGFFRKEGQSF